MEFETDSDMTKKRAYIVFVIAIGIGYLFGTFAHSEFFHFFANLFGG